MTALILAAALATAPVPAVGAPVTVERPTRGPVVAVLGDLVVSSQVVGDVVAVGGDVELTSDATVEGDVVALGGRVVGAGKATGRVVSLGGLGFGSGALAARPSGRAVWGLSLVRIGVWVMLGTFLLLLAPRSVRGAGEQVLHQLWQTPLIGVLALMVWLVVVVLALGVLSTPLGAGCLLLAVAVLLLAKLVGVVGIAWTLGSAAVRMLPVPWRGDVPRTGIALLLVTGLSTVPLLGPALWLVANVVGIGAVVGALLRRYAVALSVARLATR
jgi:hypothetical protein